MMVWGDRRGSEKGREGGRTGLGFEPERKD